MNNYDTPMMRQHSDIKNRYPDAFLFFRCGDFYELFGQDAVEASRILDITLTKRQNEIPMCGVPYHAADVYINKMIKAGKKVAICEQMEDPKLVKGLVKRDVTEIITPGTVVEEKHLLNKSNNFLLALNIKGMWVELSYIDISTGDFEISEVELSRDLSYLKGEFSRIMPREIIISEDVLEANAAIAELFYETENILVNRYPAWFFDKKETDKIVFEHFGVECFKSLGISDAKTDITTPGVVLRYLKENFKGELKHIRRLIYSTGTDKMQLDESTIRNLELLRNQNDGTVVNSMLNIIDKTSTAMGGRLLKRWIVEPLVDINKINYRLDIVELFFKNKDLLDKIVHSVKNIIDLERLSSRLVMDKATPKDLVAIKDSLVECKKIKNIISNYPQLDLINREIESLDDVVDMISKAIKDEPATFIDEGNIVKDGFLPELDDLKKIVMEGKEYITNIEVKIKEKYNTHSLKVKYNKIIGYFFEVSKLQSVNLDDTFILRQSLLNQCRYTNKELSEYESKVLTAREKINDIEKNVFIDVKDGVLRELSRLQKNALAVSELDVLLSFALLSSHSAYTRPTLNDGFDLLIEEGRHPVIETKLEYNEFIPNDIAMNKNSYLMIITGPNMAGKSTYLRQNALIVLLAQIGCFVPAKNAVIGVVDRIFTRIGTSDNLSRGESTFFVEMSETANILKKATGRSFIIMDEIGRGTSTYDGLAIAWAILEYIHDKRIMGAKTLFATHYHELTGLGERDGFKNFSVAVTEDGDSVIFLHKIIPDQAEKSYGIHVAKLAGMPDEVVNYAQQLLAGFENKNSSSTANEKKVEYNSLFDFNNTDKSNAKYKEITDIIKFIDIDRVTPIQALNTLFDLQKKIKKIVD